MYCGPCDTLTLEAHNSVNFRSALEKKILACSEKPDLSDGTKNVEIKSQEKIFTFFFRRHDSYRGVLPDSWIACIVKIEKRPGKTNATVGKPYPAVC